jgi:hypothetical protein
LVDQHLPPAGQYTLAVPKAKSRWEIENQGFNKAKAQHNFENFGVAPDPARPHHLLTLLALTIERLYRLRYLDRGCHPRLSPIQFVVLPQLEMENAFLR